jgi:4-hydroxyphenylpyruvate dioxygenase
MGRGGANDARVAEGIGASAAADGVGRPDRTLGGFKNYTRSNPLSDRFKVHKFHHVEFWCGDATNTSKR